MIGNKEAWMKADEEVSHDLQYYMSNHDAQERLFELCEIVLFPTDRLETKKLSGADRYKLMQDKVLAWYEFEVNKRAEEINDE